MPVVVEPVPADELVCKRCLFQSKNVREIMRHLKNKTKCIPIDIDHDFDPDDLVKKIRNLENKKYKCEYCQQLFSHSPNKIVHERYNCQVRKNVIQTPIEELVDINKEDLSIVPDNIIDAYIYDRGNVHVNFDIIEMIKYIHFNPAYPQFQNIRKRNINLGIVTVFQGGKWIDMECENIIKMMILFVTMLFEKRVYVDYESNEAYTCAATARLSYFMTNKHVYVNVRNFILIRSDQFV
jgi:hypothetical protein